MPTLQDWCDQLDAEPENLILRSVFADWLEEQGGDLAVLAPGFRALAATGYRPRKNLWKNTGNCSYMWDSPRSSPPGTESNLPWSWFNKNEEHHVYHLSYNTLHEAEMDAAEMWSRMSALEQVRC